MTVPDQTSNYPEVQGPARALIYLRVSTKQQSERDLDPEGYSIPAQRDACTRKAENLGAVVVAEYIDLVSGTSSKKRPQFWNMVERVKHERDVDYVIVHKLDRFARNARDDANILFELQVAGAKLVSVSENIDDTPSGMLLHRITAAVNEYYSRNLSSEVQYKTLQKARNGGTPTLAPIGYLNAPLVLEDREIRTVIVDPVRGPLITWAFDAYASGEYTLSTLTETLAEKGLTQRPTRTRAERPIPRNRVQELLRRRYYLGYVTYGGVEYDGRHPPLTTPQIFEQVQQRLDAQRTGGDRSYRRQHYLKGSLRCRRCGSRLLFFVSTGNGGRYEYFYCAGRHSGRTSCDLPHIAAHRVEAEVTASYRAEQLAPDLLTDLRRSLEAELAERIETVDRDRQRLRTRISQLRRDRYKWAEKAWKDAVPDDIARDKQAELGRQLDRAVADLAALEVADEHVRNLLTATLTLAGDCYRAYKAAEELVRRQWNQAWFSKIEVDVENDAPVVRTARTPLFEAVHHDAAVVRERTINELTSLFQTERTDGAFAAVGSNVTTLVDKNGRRSNNRSCSNLRLSWR